MTNSEIKIKALKAIGGTEWEKAGHHRVYFNRAAEKFGGIEICRSNVNFYSAKNFEIYYDVDADEFVSRADGVEETAVVAIEAIKAACDFDGLTEEVGEKYNWKAYTTEEIQEAKENHAVAMEYTGLLSEVHINETNENGDVIDFEVYLADENGNMVTGYTEYFGYRD